MADGFWSKVDVRGPHECWEWTRGRMKSGYGETFIGGRVTYAHRHAWTLTNGPIPGGMFICHRCDNPPCCNPAHLFLGTHRDNMRDCKAKLRHQHGERSSHAVLSEKDVVQIRQRRAAGEPMRRLASAFGVTMANVQAICCGRSWPNAGGPIAKPKGRGRGTTKIRGDRFAEVRRLREAGETQVAIAAKLGVSQTTIHNIIHGKRKTAG